eukprot:CAMPEP_0194287734 /NCGR_PEP_ID=MMETSP0169-20130528/35380_1 /TAXON_ID=218684 /ORGANISM="Corethron pennatum, Strain L29A3" /LENGTH=648 /DNA_ID=CAMNT_0039034529 /DNA_START=631 /DNA_END=2574 /DNA_ORIENTATION=-
MAEIYNRDEKSCFHLVTSPSMIKGIPESFIAHPLGPEMKMKYGTVRSILGNNDNIDLSEIVENFSGFDGLLCPTASATQPFDQPAIKNIWSNLIPHLEEKIELESAKNLALPKESESHVWSSIIGDAATSVPTCDEFFDEIVVVLSDVNSDVKISLGNSELASKKCCLFLLSVLASSPIICSVSLTPEIQSRNLESQWIAQSGISQYRPFFDIGLTGKGQTVAVSDSGLDIDNCYFWDTSGSVTKNGSVDQTRRKVIQYVNYVDDTDRVLGHGTHIAGTIAGRRAANGITETDGLATGHAPDAKIAFYDIGNSTSFEMRIPLNREGLFEDGRTAGARIHSVSWGASSDNANVYGPLDLEFDDYTYRHKEFLIIVAAGNGGAECDLRWGCRKPEDLTFNVQNTILSPAVAKNVLTVGSSNNQGKSKVYWFMQDQDNVAYFSARGPTSDGRTKPDILAPGMAILSAAARPDQVGECDPDDKNGINYYSLKKAKSGIVFLEGTSMSAPVVAGAAALVRQYFEEGYYPSGVKNSFDSMKPSGVLVKAAIINGGQPMVKVQNFKTFTNTEPYDQAQGYGLINLIKTLPIRGKNRFNAKVIDLKMIKSGKTHSWLFKITNSTNGENLPNAGNECKNISATLTWYDPAGVVGCSS